MTDKRKIPRATRGTPSARGQIGRAARVASGGLTMKMEQQVTQAEREVRKAEKKVKQAQRRAFGGGGTLKLVDLTGRPGGLNRKIVR